VDRSYIGPVIFAVIVFGLGISCVAFPYKIRSMTVKLTGGRSALLSSNQTIPSIRFGGIAAIVMAILIGLVLIRGD
jgi:hypothetical protein